MAPKKKKSAAGDADAGAKEPKTKDGPKEKKAAADDPPAGADAYANDPPAGEDADAGAKKQKTKDGKARKAPALKVPEGPIPRSATPRAPAVDGAISAIYWNVSGLNGLLKQPERLELLHRLVEEERPTVICFSEHKLSEDKAEAGAKALAKVLEGYTSAHWALCSVKKGYAGVAVYVRDGVAVHNVRLDDVCDLHEGRTISLELDRVWLVATYSPNSGDGLRRLGFRIETWDPALAAHVASLEAGGKPVSLIGDLNVAPLDVDIWNHMAKHVSKSAGTTPEERASFARLVGAPWGPTAEVQQPYATTLVDAFRHKHPDATGEPRTETSGVTASELIAGSKAEAGRELG
jgi:exodeoxyribonuclease III